jgi:hypothetical protein
VNPESQQTLEWNTYFSNMSRERQDPYQKAAIEKLDKYLLEVGRATNNWNFLHELLKLIFCFLLRPDQIEANEAITGDFVNAYADAGTFYSEMNCFGFLTLEIGWP